MTFVEYMKAHPKTDLKALAVTSGVSLQTLKACARGMKLSRYEKAEGLSKATGGACTIAELCDPLKVAK